MYKADKIIPIILFLLWWSSWLVIHNTSLSPIFVASLRTQLYFLLMMFMVLVGYMYAYLHTKKNINITPMWKHYEVSKNGKWFLVISIVLVFLMFVFIGHSTGAFSMSPNSYFYSIRGSSGMGSKLSGSKYSDILIGIFIYPFMFSVWLIFMVLFKSKFKSRMIIAIVILTLLFSYIYQINYPVGAVAYTLLIYLVIFKRNELGRIQKKTKRIIFYSILVFGVLMIYAGATRLGKFNLVGIFSRYLVSYHTLGFYFFDVKLHDPHSILHSMSFGRSVLGWFDSVFDLVIRLFNDNLYIAANLQNKNDNMIPIVSGVYNGYPLTGNAFGTWLFTMYRDFGVMGIAVYSFIYGFFLAYSYSKADLLKWKALFVVLFLAGIKSIGVSVFERSFFWFCVLFVSFFFYFFVKEKPVGIYN